MKQILALLLAALSGLNAQYAQGQVESLLPPAPGQMVDVGGYDLHLYCTGEGARTVILDAGMGDWSLQFRALQEKISEFATVCTFDRAGYGWSDASPHPRTSEQIVSELKSLLEAGGVEGPVVLAGHSFGGLDTILFANQYPELVAGVVLIDSSHPDQKARLAAVPELLALEAAEMEGFHAIVAASKRGELTPAAVLPIAPAGLPQELRETWSRSFIQPKSLETAIAELAAVDQSSAQVRENGSLGDIPLVVIARGLKLGDLMPVEVQQQAGLTPELLDRYEAIWRELQEDHLTRSRDSRLVVASNSPHYVYMSEPDLVVAAIRELVERQ